jgi:NAD(P)-dependent dehydrogenase (short-subunit alcohol dehydrogenase family)
VTTTTTESQVQREPELLGQTVAVIGGSSGIGLETARRARAEGAEVIVTGRDPEHLSRAALELGGVRTAAFDATDQSALDRFFGDLTEPVDHVMVTAGRQYYARLAEMDFAQARRALEEHLLMPLRIGRNAAGKVRPGGTLIFMTGTAARHPGPALVIAAHRVRGPARPRRQPGTRARAGPGQPHRRWLRRHAAVGLAAGRST